MGQPIEISGTTVDGDVAALHTDRALTGQDGLGFPSRDHAERDASFPGDLVVRLFDGVAGIDHVFVASNQVVARRTGGWDDDALSTASRIVTDFFVFYSEA